MINPHVYRVTNDFTYMFIYILFIYNIFTSQFICKFFLTNYLSVAHRYPPSNEFALHVINGETEDFLLKPYSTRFFHSLASGFHRVICGEYQS